MFRRMHPATGELRMSGKTGDQIWTASAAIGRWRPRPDHQEHAAPRSAAAIADPACASSKTRIAYHLADLLRCSRAANFIAFTRYHYRECRAFLIISPIACRSSFAGREPGACSEDIDFSPWCGIDKHHMRRVGVFSLVPSFIARPLRPTRRASALTFPCRRRSQG